MENAEQCAGDGTMGTWEGAWGLFRIAYNGSHLGLTLIRISDKQAFVVHMFTLALALRCLHYTEGVNNILRNTIFVWWYGQHRAFQL